jgi:hypothetical protein
MRRPAYFVDDEQYPPRGAIRFVPTLPVVSFSSLPEPLPPNSTRQRTLQFNTLTKSYFGPAYAKSTKIQRATLLSEDRLLVIENVTHLSDIPYADRFRVLERWVLEVEEGGGECAKDAAVGIIRGGYDDDASRRQLEESNPGGGERTSSASAGERGIRVASTAPSGGASCRLTIHAEVQMLKPCPWEHQIRKKASETFTEVAADWCKSATVALAATEEQMRKRLRVSPPEGGGNDRNIVFGGGGGGGIGGGMDSGPGRPPLSHPSLARGGSGLLAIHKRNFDHLEKHFDCQSLLGARTSGDLEWCSIEVMHSSPGRRDDGAGGRSFASSLPAFSTVLEYPSLNEYEIACPTARVGARDDSIKMAGFTSQRKKAAVMMRTKSRKLFKKLSSRPRPGAPKKR